MEITNYKKTIGRGLLVLFMVYLINVLVGHLPLVADSVFNNIRDWWFALSQVIQVSAVIFVAFNRHSQASIVSKIGAILYSILMLIYLSDRIVFNLSGAPFFYFHGIGAIFCHLILSSGLLLFVWGLRKLWLPIKLVTTLDVIVSIIENLILSKLAAIYSNMSDDSIEQIESLQNMIDGLMPVFIIIFIAIIVLTIVWMCLRSKVPSVQNHNIDII